VRVSRHGDAGRQAIPRSDTFTGMVWGEPLLDDLPDTLANNVRFAPGARTYWHRHRDGQILHVTEGRGKVRSRGGEEVIVGPGDTVWVPPGEEHYHGADLDRFLVHIAISFGAVEWLEPVSDEDYGGPG
jgi:quercetin dioxygenase-like cupin family protein